MKINAERIARLRKEKSWSQEELAIGAGLNLRTIQRIEKEASASLRSKRALATALEIDIHDLDYEEMQMQPCPECNSNNIYEYKDDIEFGGFGGELLPKLSTGMFSLAKFRPVICSDCGNIRFFISNEAKSMLVKSKSWKRVKV